MAVHSQEPLAAALNATLPLRSSGTVLTGGRRLDRSCTWCRLLAFQGLTFYKTPTMP